MTQKYFVATHELENTTTYLLTTRQPQWKAYPQDKQPRLKFQWQDGDQALTLLPPYEESFSELAGPGAGPPPPQAFLYGRVGLNAIRRSLNTFDIARSSGGEFVINPNNSAELFLFGSGIPVIAGWKGNITEM